MGMKNTPFALPILLLFAACSKHSDVTVPKLPASDTPRVIFSKTFGGNQDDFFYAIAKTPDGGYVMAGSTLSGNGNGDIPSTPTVGGNNDMLIVKVGADGTKQWVTDVGGDQDDFAQAVMVCPDGSGYMIAGSTNSNNTGDIPPTRGGNDMAVVKLGPDGKKLWVKTYGGASDEIARSIEVSTDGKSYVIAGSTTSNNSGDIPAYPAKEFAFFSEIVVANLQPTGEINWIKTFGGSFSEATRSIVTSPDGSGYVLAGYTSSDSSVDIPKTHNGTTGITDMLVLKLGTDGSKKWVKTYGGADFDFATCIAASRDGGYMVAGMTGSNNSGDIPPTMGDDDIVVIRLDANGNKLSLRTYGGNGDDEAFSIAAAPNGDYVIAGFTGSNDNGDIPPSHAAAPSYLDMLVGRLGPDGSKKWIKAYGGNANDQGIAVANSTDGGFVIAGYTSSLPSFDIPGNHGPLGTNDGWILKVKEGL
jgi:hypothetical protein